MARTPPSTIDFAPAWLNFNSTNKKRDKPVEQAGLPYLHQPSQAKANQLLWSGSNHKSAGFQTADCGHWPVQTALNLQRVGENKSWRQSGSRQKPFAHARLNRSADAGLYKSDADFPSLGTSSCISTSANQSKSMWDKPLVLKIQETDGNLEQSCVETDRREGQTNSIYKALVPRANSATTKPSYRRTVSVPASARRDESRQFVVDKDPNPPNKHSIYTKRLAAQSGKRSPQPQGRKPAIPQSTEHQQQGKDRPTMLALAVKHNRRGKNLFLGESQASAEQSPVEDADPNTSSSEFQENAERLDDGVIQQIPCGVVTSPSSEFTPQEDEAIDYWDDVADAQGEQAPTVTDHNNENLANLGPPLSSSLEAEYRLLREMGWTEDWRTLTREWIPEEDEEQPLTDDEIREFFTRNERKGLLAVPSVSHRASAFRKALNNWSNANQLRRDMAEEIQCKGPSPDSQFSFSDTD